jgi:predicted DNA-binding transcriptional regulator AlpA
MEIKKRLLSVEELSVVLNIAKKTIYNSTSPNSEKPFPIKPLRINGAIRFCVDDVEDYISGLKSCLPPVREVKS